MSFVYGECHSPPLSMLTVTSIRSPWPCIVLPLLPLSPIQKRILQPLGISPKMTLETNFKSALQAYRAQQRESACWYMIFPPPVYRTPGPPKARAVKCQFWELWRHYLSTHTQLSGTDGVKTFWKVWGEIHFQLQKDALELNNPTAQAIL